MTKFSCICQNYHGYLSVTKQECYFTSSLFRVDLQWDNIKKIRLDTKQIKGVPTSVLVVKLQRTQAASVAADESESPTKHKKSLSKKYFFYGFQDLLGAEDQMKKAWEAYLSSEAKTGASSSRRAPSEDKVESDGSVGSEKPPLPDEVRSNASAPVEAAPTKSNASMAAPSTHHKAESESRRASTNARRKSAASRRTTSESSLLIPAETGSGRQSGVLYRIRTLCANLHTSLLHFFIGGGTMSVVVSSVLLCLLVFGSLHLYQWGVRKGVLPRTDDGVGEADDLLRDLQSLQRTMKSLDSFTSVQQFSDSRKRKTQVLREGMSWVTSLQRSSAALVREYVSIQTALANLRGRRLERLRSLSLSPDGDSQEGWHVFGGGRSHTARYYVAPLTPDDSATAWGSQSSAFARGDSTGTPDSSSKAQAPGRRRPRRFSVWRIADDLERWGNRINKVTSFVTSLFWTTHSPLSATSSPTHRSQAKSTELIRYSEPFLEGFDMTQYVTPEEKHERQECLRLSSELLRVSRQLEHLFAAFTSSVMTETYDKWAQGMERPHFWSSPPPSVLSGHGTPKRQIRAKVTSRVPRWTPEQVMQVILLRRYADVIVHLNPLEANEQRRRMEAVQFTNLLLELSELENELESTRYTTNRTNEEALLRFFHDHISHRVATDVADPTLRNIVDELRFWDDHDDLWVEHLLTSLPVSQQKKLASLAAGGSVSRSAATADKAAPRGESGGGGGHHDHPHNSSTTAAVELRREVLKWKGLPVFRGLLCFSGRPHLVRSVRDGKGDVEEEVPLAPQSEAPTAARTSHHHHETSSSRGHPANQHAAVRDANPDDGIASPPPPRDETTRPPTVTVVSVGTVPAALPSPPPPPPPPPPPRPPEYTTHIPEVCTDHEGWKPPHSDAETLHDQLQHSKVHWMSELNNFLSTFDERTVKVKGRTRPRLRTQKLEEETEYIEPGAAAARHRLFRILERINAVYVMPLLSHSSRLRRFLWPPSWIRAVFRASREEPSVTAVRVMGTADPTVQYATTQLLGVSWGSLSDTPLTMLDNFLLQPPPLLALKKRVKRQIAYDFFVLVLGITLVVVALLLL